MSTTDYFVLCETITQDEKGRVSLINIFDSISTEELPAKPGKITIAFSFEIEPGLLNKTLSLTVQIDDPEGETLLNARGEVGSQQKIATQENTAARIISAISIPSPEFKIYGEYKYRLILEDKTLAENCLRVLNDKSIERIDGEIKKR